MFQQIRPEFDGIALKKKRKKERKPEKKTPQSKSTQKSMESPIMWTHYRKVAPLAVADNKQKEGRYETIFCSSASRASSFFFCPLPRLVAGLKPTS